LKWLASGPSAVVARAIRCIQIAWLSLDKVLLPAAIERVGETAMLKVYCIPIHEIIQYIEVYDETIGYPSI
jgi:hypothetical protein